MPRLPLAVLPCALLLSACGDHEPPAARDAPRPVEVYELREVDPAGPLEITGSVRPWKEQDVAFEVSGRVQFVQERGTSLEGRWEEAGEVRVEGQVLAELDERPFAIAVAVAEAQASVAREQIGVVESQLEDVLPANLRAAVAEQARAEAEHQRYRQAGESDAVSEIDVLRAKTSHDVASAKVEQAQAAFRGREAEKRSLESSHAQANEQVEDARWNLGRCRLYAPFTAEVSEVYVEAGGFARAGERVAHLVMMDPIQVDVAVSGETLRELERYSPVLLSVPGVPEPVSGRIYDLATVADPRTRTFRVSIIVRNEPRAGVLGISAEERELPRTQHLLLPIHAPQEPTGPWYVEARRSLRQDEQGWFVWASSDPEHALGLDRDRPVLTVRKVRVTPGERRQNYQGIYVLRELADAGELREDSLLPLDLPVDFPDGGRVLLADSGWMLQPGQVVSVSLAGEGPAPGLFVPMGVVLPENADLGRVFVVEDGRARSVRIDLRDRVGALVRVQALDPEGAALLGNGAQVIRQAHFLHEGEAVRVVRAHEVLP